MSHINQPFPQHNPTVLQNILILSMIHWWHCLQIKSSYPQQKKNCIYKINFYISSHFSFHLIIYLNMLPSFPFHVLKKQKIKKKCYFNIVKEQKIRKKKKLCNLWIISFCYILFASYILLVMPHGIWQTMTESLSK